MMSKMSALFFWIDWVSASGGIYKLGPCDPISLLCGRMWSYEPLGCRENPKIKLMNVTVDHKSNLPQLKLKPKNINQICHNWSWYAFWPFNKLRKAEVRAHVADLPSVLKIGHAGYQILDTSLHARVAHHCAPWQQQGSMGWWLILSKDHCHEFLLRSGWGPWFGAGVCELEHELLKFLDPKCHAPMYFLST